MTAYHSCSEVLRPPFVHFLQDVSQSPGLPFQGEGHSKGGPGPRACLRGYRPGSQQEGKSREPGPSQSLGPVRPDALTPLLLWRPRRGWCAGLCGQWAGRRVRGEVTGSPEEPLAWGRGGGGQAWADGGGSAP